MKEFEILVKNGRQKYAVTFQVKPEDCRWDDDILVEWYPSSI